MFPKKLFVFVFALAAALALPTTAVYAADPGQLVTPDDFQREPAAVQATFLAVYGDHAAKAWAYQHNSQVRASNGRTFAEELSDPHGGAVHFLGVYGEPWLAAKAWVEEVASSTPTQWPVTAEEASKAFGHPGYRSGNPDQWERCPGEEACWHLKDGVPSVVTVPGAWFEGWDGRKKLGPSEGPRRVIVAGITIRPKA
jgi:hypothetical protein